MKSKILFLCLLSFAPFVVQAQWHRHKSEDKIAQMTPSQRVDEFVNEEVHHRFEFSDDQSALIRKYIEKDGLKALPRLIEIINEYDPTRFREGKGKRGDRFDASFLMLGYLDDFSIRLRASDEGKLAINALERAVQRMQKVGYGQPDQDEWEKHGRFDLAVMQVGYFKGVNRKDKDIRSTLRFIHKIKLSDTELFEFSNFLTARYPDYSGWSMGKLVKDENQLGPGGYPVQIIVLNQPERYYASYLEFKETK